MLLAAAAVLFLRLTQAPQNCNVPPKHSSDLQQLATETCCNFPLVLSIFWGFEGFCNFESAKKNAKCNHDYWNHVVSGEVVDEYILISVIESMEHDPEKPRTLSVPSFQKANNHEHTKAYQKLP